MVATQLTRQAVCTRVNWEELTAFLGKTQRLTQVASFLLAVYLTSACQGFQRTWVATPGTQLGQAMQC